MIITCLMFQVETVRRGINTSNMIEDLPLKNVTTFRNALDA